MKILHAPLKQRFILGDSIRDTLGILQSPLSGELLTANQILLNQVAK